MFTKRFTVTLGAIALSAALTACGGGDGDSGDDAAAGQDCTPRHEGLTTVSSGKLTVATYELPPFVTVAGGEVTGAEGDVITEIAAMECLEVTAITGAAAAAIPAVTSGRADTALGSWYRTAERGEVLLLGAPAFKDQLMIVSTDDAAIDTIDGLVGKRVGAVIGYLWVEDLQTLLGNDLNLYQNADGMYRDLAAGRIDALIDGAAVVTTQLGRTPVDGAVSNVPPADDRVASTTQPGQIQFGVAKENPALREALDANLEELRESGRIEEILVDNGFPAELADPGEPSLL